MTPLFLDTSFVVGLAFTNDSIHQIATKWSDRIARSRSPIVTTDAVCLEIGNGLARLSTKTFAVGFLQRLMADPNVHIVHLAEALLNQALDLYRSRPDKEWGLTDCVSFVVMQDLGITDALTADRHFEQAGFTALLRES